MKIRQLPLETLASWVARRRFVYVRYGDGEFGLMDHSIDQNCDGVVYSKELAQGLFESLNNKDITHCISALAVHLGADKWLAENARGVEWYKADQVQEACDNGLFWPLRSMLYHRHMLYIGPERIRLVAQEALGADDLIDVPLTTAFESIEEIVENATKAIQERGYTFVGVSAGPAAKIIIDRLSRVFHDVSFMDFGSLLDVYAGIPTRSGAKKLTSKQIIDLAWKNFHWQISTPIPMDYPSIHDLMNIPGLVSESEANFLYKQACSVKGTIVELGTFRGRTAAVLARTGNGVVSIDNYTYPLTTAKGTPAHNLKKYGLSARFIQSDSAIIPNDINNVALLYVDSDHSYEHVSIELDAWLPRVTGIVVFHDYEKDTYQGVKKAAQEKMSGWQLIGTERTMAAFRRK